MGGGDGDCRHTFSSWFVPLEASMMHSGHFGNTFSLKLSSMTWLKFPDILQSFGELLKI